MPYISQEQKKEIKQFPMIRIMEIYQNIMSQLILENGINPIN